MENYLVKEYILEIKRYISKTVTLGKIFNSKEFEQLYYLTLNN